MPQRSPRDPRTAVDKAMSLLKAFGDEAYVGVGLSVLARRADLSKSTAFRLLATLQTNGAVERAGSAYRLGSMIQGLGQTRETDYQGWVRDALTPSLTGLYEYTRHTVHLAVLEGTDVVYLNKLYGPRAVKSPSRIGGRVPAYSTAVGKVLLSQDPRAVKETLNAGLRAWTPNTITDPEAFRAEILEVRRRGLAYDREEAAPGLCCVGAPVFDRQKKVVASLSISGAAGRFIPSDVEEVLRKVCFEASRAVSALDIHTHIKQAHHY